MRDFSEFLPVRPPSEAVLYKTRIGMASCETPMQRPVTYSFFARRLCLSDIHTSLGLLLQSDVGCTAAVNVNVTVHRHRRRRP